LILNFKMKDWIEYYIGVKLFLIIIGIVLVIAGFILGSKFYEQNKLDEYKGVSEAVVTNITMKKVQSKHIYETIEKTVGYDITYIFHLKDKKYSETETINSSSETINLFNNFSKGDSCFLEIKYAIRNPSESIISKPIFK